MRYDDTLEYIHIYIHTYVSYEIDIIFLIPPTQGIKRIFFLGNPQMQCERLKLPNITSVQYGSHIGVHVLCCKDKKGISKNQTMYNIS